MTALASTDDLEVQWRTLTGAEVTRAEVLLQVASARVRDRVARIDDRIARGQLDPQLAAYVVVSMVKRVMTAREQNEPIIDAMGPASVQWLAQQASDMVITDDELDLLRPPASGRPRSAQLGVGIPLP